MENTVISAGNVGTVFVKIKCGMICLLLNKMIILVNVVLPAILTVVCILLNPNHRIFIIWIVFSLQRIKGLVINRYIS
ncbi:hypothetical protein [African swine fever virus]|nr:hypothetical protein [African swine fever virus]UNZ12329.1 hypothetical protein [African swine fever virus]